MSINFIRNRGILDAQTLKKEKQQKIVFLRFSSFRLLQILFFSFFEVTFSFLQNEQHKAQQSNKNTLSFCFTKRTKQSKQLLSAFSPKTKTFSLSFWEGQQVAAAGWGKLLKGNCQGFIFFLLTKIEEKKKVNFAKPVPFDSHHVTNYWAALWMKMYTQCFWNVWSGQEGRLNTKCTFIWCLRNFLFLLKAKLVDLQLLPKCFSWNRKEQSCSAYFSEL